MAAKALGPEKVIAASMPCESQGSDIADAILVSDKFGVRSIEVDLTDIFEDFTEEIGEGIEWEPLSNDTLINIKPRLRMTTLYGIAQTLGCLVIGTGNLSERMVRVYNKMGR